MRDLLEFVSANPTGDSVSEIEQHLNLSRPTLNRRLKAELLAGTIVG